VGKWFDIGWHATTNQFELSDNYVTTDPIQAAAASDGFLITPRIPRLEKRLQTNPFRPNRHSPESRRARLGQFE
jgi:hypothetical protein